jgi:uncharacterized protein
VRRVIPNIFITTAAQRGTAVARATAHNNNGWHVLATKGITMERIISPISIKSSPDDGDGIVVGHPAIFNHPDDDGDIIAPGAFRRSIQESKSGAKAWPVFLLQLDADSPIGSVTSMDEDDNGLLIRAKIAPTTRGKEILSLLRMKPRPALSGLGVGFRAKSYTPTKTGRTLTDLDLVAVSLVTFPSQRLATVISVKAAPPATTYTAADQVRDDWAMLCRTMNANNRSGW